MIRERAEAGCQSGLGVGVNPLLTGYLLDTVKNETVRYSISTHITVRYFNITVNLSNAEATLGQSTRAQRILKSIQTLSCWYSLESSRRELADKYPCARVWTIFTGFLHYFVLANLATSTIKVIDGTYRFCCE